MSDGGTFHVTMTPEGDVLSGEQSVFHLHLHNHETEGSLEGATVLVDPWMPSMGHGVSADPVTTEIGNGDYETALEFTMVGTWEVNIDIDDGVVNERAVFNIDVQ